MKSKIALVGSLMLATYASVGPLRAEEKTDSIYGGGTVAMPASPLDVRPELAAKVSFEAKSQPLHELLAELGKQSGVGLSAAESFGPQVRVTARAKEMSLAEVMNALSRLYQADWQSADDGKSYTFTPLALSAWEKQLAQVGEAYWYRHRDVLLPSPENLSRSGNALSEQIWREVPLQALRSKEGVSIWKLSGDTQEALRWYLARSRGKNVIGDHFREVEWRDLIQNQDLEVRLEVGPDTKAAIAAMEAQRTEEGNKVTAIVPLIAQLFDKSGQFIASVKLELPNGKPIPIEDEPVADANQE